MHVYIILVSAQTIDLHFYKLSTLWIKYEQDGSEGRENMLSFSTKNYVDLDLQPTNLVQDHFPMNTIWVKNELEKAWENM